MAGAAYTQAQIVAAIRRTAAENGGVPLGKARFEAATGIRETDWAGRYWARWTDAVRDAGLVPNERPTRREDGDLLRRLAELCRELGHFPSRDELRLAVRRDPTFPVWVLTKRFKDRDSMTGALLEFSGRESGFEDVYALCASVAPRVVPRVSGKPAVEGYVYLLKSGRHFKIGRSNAVGRRERELQIQLPERANEVHRIATDDPVGIERYWHSRFEDRRKNGEWFQLTADDVAAFRRRKFM